MARQRCLNDATLAFDTDKGCPTTGCYRNNNGICQTTPSAVPARQMAVIADVVGEITTAIDLTQQCTAVKHIDPLTKRFYEAKRRFFTEADITVGQLQAAMLQGINWIELIHSKRIKVTN